MVGWASRPARATRPPRLTRPRQRHRTWLHATSTRPLRTSRGPVTSPTCAPGKGWLFGATVIDLYSRSVIGWALADHLRASLVGDALEMAVATRGGHVDGVVFHSDRGCQYTSAEFAQLR